jgi:hypothetical protein
VTTAPSPRPSSCDVRTEWTCHDGTCVGLQDRCDRRKYDCPDGSDETGCDAEPEAPTNAPVTPSHCDPKTQWTCKDGLCIALQDRCDRLKYDCSDGSDEFDCDG